MKRHTQIHRQSQDFRARDTRPQIQDWSMVWVLHKTARFILYTVIWNYRLSVYESTRRLQLFQQLLKMFSLVIDAGDLYCPEEILLT